MKTLIIAILIAGCATTEGFEQRLQSQVGRNINDVIRGLGKPSQVYKLPDGSVAYEFFYDNGGKITYLSNTTLLQERNCTWTYFTTLGIVTAWAHKGGECKSRPIK